MRISDWSSDVCSSDLRRARSAHDPASGLECKDTDHLRHSEQAGGPVRPLRAGKSAGAGAIAKQDRRHRDAFVESFGFSKIQASAVMPVKGNDPTKIGPEEGALREGAGADHGIAAVLPFTED